VSPIPPEIARLPLAGVHLSGFAAVVSVHSTILSAPVKHTSLTEAVPSLSVALPLQGAPDVIEKPPIGPHELIVVGGTGGCGATCKHPAAINPAIAAPAISDLAIVGLKTAALEIIPRILPPPQLAYDERFDPAFATFILASSGNRVASVEGGRKTEKIGRVGGRTGNIVSRRASPAGAHRRGAPFRS
jgi:hypothetical protein